jgi:hypothetical protein
MCQSLQHFIFKGEIMAEPKKSSAMLPLIIVGATLFGFGTYQSLKPKDAEVNQGFVAPPESVSIPDNPRTMQAPDAPAPEKDAAARAAEATETTKATDLEANVNGVKLKLSVSEAPWLQGIMTGALGNFREGVLKNLKEQQAKGGINCAPLLTNMEQAALSKLEAITCTTKDGGQIKGEFDEAGDGELRIDDTDGARVTVSKNNGDFNVETRAAN